MSKHNKPYKVLLCYTAMEEEQKEGEPVARGPQERREMSEQEKRVRSLTRAYYSQAKIQEALVKLAAGREVVPRYFEQFGKRPDTLQYVSDVMALVNKGATSFHASEEVWRDVLAINAEMAQEELAEQRVSWDLLIDIDSRFFDCSRIAATLILEMLETYGVKNIGMKFSGSKGLHLMVSGAAFPEEHEGVKMQQAFPEWPRAICQYIMHRIRKAYNERVALIMPPMEVLEKRMQKTREELMHAVCPKCGRASEKGEVMTYVCDDCGTVITRKDMKQSKRALRCITCPGMFRVEKSEEYFFCPVCKTSSFDAGLDTGEGEESGKVTFTKEGRSARAQLSDEFSEEIAGEVLGGLDLVLVAPRHLFRMPYSLHEKTALASVVLTKEELTHFTLRDANPLKVQVREFAPQNIPGEATRLLAAALAWKREYEAQEQALTGLERGKSRKRFDDVELKGVTEQMFPPAIEMLLRGLSDGKKRGLFVLVTFLRSCGFSTEEIEKRVREWNQRNSPPLKEGYVRSQLDWHFRQKKKILPPNYEHEVYYKDLGLFKEKPKTKNPVVDVMRALWKLKEEQWET